MNKLRYFIKYLLDCVIMLLISLNTFFYVFAASDNMVNTDIILITEVFALICIILIVYVLYCKLFRARGNSILAFAWYTLSLLYQYFLISAIFADNDKYRVQSTLLSLCMILVINVYTIFNIQGERSNEEKNI